MCDPGLIMMVREAFPEQTVHLSVQANAVNYATVKYWAAQGIKRVILSRELGLNEIEEIRQQCPDTELEVFVHGALCMAYSGRCLLSGYMNKRDPNQGACTNACRWQYSAQPAQQDDAGNIVAKWSPEGQPIEPTLGLGATAKDAYTLTERMRPDKPMAAFEGEHGTYIINSRDLRAIQHVHALTQMGIDSLKIEGRTKSFYYCARTAQVYRRVIDAAKRGEPFELSALYDLDKLANGGYTEGFLRRHTHDMYQNYETGASVSDQQQLVGEAIGTTENGAVVIDVKNRFALGDRLEWMTPKGNIDFTLTHMSTLKGEKTERAPGSGHKVSIALPKEAPFDGFGVLLRYLTENETTRGFQPAAAEAS